MTTEIDIRSDWKIVWITSENFNSSISLVESGSVDGFGISQYKGFGSKDISFISRVAKVKALVIPDAGADYDNLNQVEGLVNLQFLSLGKLKKPLNLRAMTKLKRLQVVWNRSLTLPPSTAPIRDLAMWSYGPKSKSLDEIAEYRKITELHLVRANIKSLAGIQKLKHLINAEFHYMRNLESVEDLQDSSVEKLVFTHCKRLTDLSALGQSPRLKTLFYHDSGPLPNLQFVRQSRSLKSFRFVGVDVLDGDLSPLLLLKDTAFTRKGHFSHTEKEVLSGIATGGK
jgi:hypothetical protein